MSCRDSVFTTLMEWGITYQNLASNPVSQSSAIFRKENRSKHNRETPTPKADIFVLDLFKILYTFLFLFFYCFIVPMPKQRTSATESFRLLDYMRSILCKCVAWKKGKKGYKDSKYKDPNNGRKMTQKDIETSLKDIIPECMRHKLIPTMFTREMKALHAYIKTGKQSEKLNLLKQRQFRLIQEHFKEIVSYNNFLCKDDKVELSDLLNKEPDLSSTIQEMFSVHLNERDVEEVDDIRDDVESSLDTNSNHQTNPSDESESNIRSVNDQHHILPNHSDKQHIDCPISDPPCISTSMTAPSPLISREIATPSSLTISASPTSSCATISCLPSWQGIDVNNSREQSLSIPSESCPTPQHCTSKTEDTTIPHVVQQFWDPSNPSNQQLRYPIASPLHVKNVCSETMPPTLSKFSTSTTCSTSNQIISGPDQQLMDCSNYSVNSFLSEEETHDDVINTQLNQGNTDIFKQLLDVLLTPRCFNDSDDFIMSDETELFC